MSERHFSIGEKNVHFSQPAASLSIGYQTIAQQFFSRNVPSAYEVEMAIANIEDNIQTTPQLHHIASTFSCHDEYLKSVAHIAGVENMISQSQIEQLFNRVADIIAGSPKQAGEFPDDKNFISYLLMLRELSHHLKIENISIS